MGRDKHITLAHGSGGTLMHELISGLIVEKLGNPILSALDDSAEIFDLGPAKLDGGRLAFTTDTYVVQPLFFPGGDIGKLAVCGTVNDLAMKGAKPLYITLGLVLEEGLPIRELERIIDSIARTASGAGVVVAAGDTKVVERGAAGGMIVNTSGIGIIPDGVDVSGDAARDGDVVVLSGTIGDHETAILIAREGLKLEEAIESDCAPLNEVVEAVLTAFGDIHVMRDPTRGGLGTTLNEIALRSHVGITIEEERIPMKPGVRAICEILGFDPLYMANEGAFVLVAPAPGADAIVEALRAHPLGREASVIGRVGGREGVYARTVVGGVRPVLMLEAAQLPRIC